MFPTKTVGSKISTLFADKIDKSWHKMSCEVCPNRIYHRDISIEGKFFEYNNFVFEGSKFSSRVTSIENLNHQQYLMRIKYGMFGNVVKLSLQTTILATI